MTDPGSVPATTFDWNALLAKLGGDESFVRGLLEVALRSTRPLPDELRAAAAAGNNESMTRLAHKIKGTTGDLCATDLRASAAAAELAARQSLPEAVALNQALADSLDEFLAELQRIVGAG